MFATEELELKGGTYLAAMYPEFVSEAVVGVVAPPREDIYGFRVLISKGASQRRYRVSLQDYNEGAEKFLSWESHQTLTKAGALRKANRLVRREMNIRGVL